MSDDSLLLGEINDKFIDIAKTYIEPAFRTNAVFVPTITANPTIVSLPTGNFDKLSTFVDVLFRGTFTAFETNYCDTSSLKPLTSGLKVKYRNYTSNVASDTEYSYMNMNILQNGSGSTATYYTSIGALNAAIPSIDSNVSTYEINLSDFMVNNGKLINILNNNRRLYGLLDDIKYQQYKALLQSTNDNAVPFTVTLYDGTVERVDKNVLQDTYFPLFSQLKGVTTYRTSTYLTSPNTGARLISSDVTSSFPSTNDRPSDVASDDVYQLAIDTSSSTARSLSMTTFGDVLRKTIGKNNKTMYYTISFFVKARPVVASGTQYIQNVPLNIKTIFNNSNQSVMDVPYSEEVNVAVSGTWKQVTLTRALTLSYDTTMLANNAHNIKLDLMFTVAHQGIATREYGKYAVLITGMRIKETDDPLQTEIQYVNDGALTFDDYTNRMVLRRILLLYELMTTYYVSVKILKDFYSAGTPFYNHVRTINYLVNEYLTNFNNNMVTETMYEGSRNTTLGYLGDRVSDGTTLYKTNYQSIQQNTGAVSDLKDVLKGNLDALSTQQSRDTKDKVFLITAIVLSVLVGLSCLVVYFMPVDPRTKVVAAATVSLFGVVLMITFKMILGTQVEKFQTSSSSFNIGGTVSILVDRARSYNLLYAKNFLQNTINIALMIQTGNTYNAVNYAMTKEDYYYQTTRKQMEISSNKVDDVRGAYSLESYTNRARVSFFINLAIIIALTSGGAIATNGIPFLRNIILVGGSVAVVLALILYILDVSRRVRTEGDKMYWMQPIVTGL